MWYKKGAEKGHASAQYHLALMYKEAAEGGKENQKGGD